MGINIGEEQGKIKGAPGAIENEGDPVNEPSMKRMFVCLATPNYFTKSMFAREDKPSLDRPEGLHRLAALTFTIHYT